MYVKIHCCPYISLVHKCSAIGMYLITPAHFTTLVKPYFYYIRCFYNGRYFSCCFLAPASTSACILMTTQCMTNKNHLIPLQVMHVYYNCSYNLNYRFVICCLIGQKLACLLTTRTKIKFIHSYNSVNCIQMLIIE